VREGEKPTSPLRKHRGSVSVREQFGERESRQNRREKDPFYMTDRGTLLLCPDSRERERVRPMRREDLEDKGNKTFHGRP